MTTVSKPVIYDAAAIAASIIDADDTNINGAQWSRLLRFAGTGVSSGFVITLSAVADTATLSAGWGMWNGYTLEITSTHTVSIPAVVSAKTYSVGVLYDPANLSVPEGPLALAVFDKASITIPSGGSFWTLYEVDRLPSTVLTNSTLRNYLVAPATTIYVPSGVALPPASEYSFGTIAVTAAGELYRRLSTPSANWSLVTDDTGTVTSGIIMSGGWTNPGASYRSVNGVTTVRLRATRTGATLTSGSTGGLADTPVLTLPSAARPTVTPETGRGTVTLADGSTQGFDWRINSAGLMSLTSANPSVAIAAGSVLYATATFIR